jgi:hypothetical protein
MSNQKSPDAKPEFTRRSETESTCLNCFQTVKTDRYAPLEEAESIHSDVCLQKHGSAQRYTLL